MYESISSNLLSACNGDRQQFYQNVVAVTALKLYSRIKPDIKLGINNLGYKSDSLFFVIGSVDVCWQSKVSDLELHVIVDEEVAEFQISMDDTLTMYMLTAYVNMKHNKNLGGSYLDRHYLSV